MLVCLFTAAAVDAEPMKLDDANARWISVRFEISPHGRPGQRDTVYSRHFPAWLEPAREPGLMRVSIDDEIVEKYLMRDQRPVPGSFSDFVWLFDAKTGEVVSAKLSGALVREVHWGLMSSLVETDIAVDMSTSELAGYEMPRRLFRNTVFPYCAAEAEADAGCTLVTPTRFQRRSGYVNAVGDLAVHSSLVTLHTFSPLGEAVFSELPGWPEAEVELTRPAVAIEPEALVQPATLLGDTSGTAPGY